MDLGLFQIKARHIINPLIFLFLSLLAKIWLESSWLRRFLQKEQLELEAEVSPLPWSITTLIVVGYLALTALFTYPLILNFAKAVPGDGGDNPMFLWNLWWTKYALLDLKTNPFFSNYIFYPVGIGLATHTFVFLHGLISIPLQLLFGLTIANNIIIILSFVLSAYGAHLLINYLIKDNLSAFIGGIIFAFCPYKFAHLLGHYNLIATQWLPFYIFFLIRLTKEKRAKNKNAFLAALFLSFTALTDFYYLIFLIIFTIIYLSYVFLQDKKVMINSDFFKAMVLFLTTFALLISPLAFMLISEIKEGSLPGQPGGAREYVADLLGFFIPSVLHPLFGSMVRPVTKNFVGNACEWTVFIGYSVILLVMMTIIKFSKNREVRFWLLSALIFFLLSFGLYPHVRGQEIKIPLPFFIINYLPLINNLRAPSRLSLMLMLSLAVLSAFSLRFLLKETKRLWLKYALFILFLAIISFEYLAIPFPMFKTQIPAVYEKIKNEKDKGVILEIPLIWQDGFRMVGGSESQAIYMYYQTYHHRPIFGGYVARIPDSKIEYFKTAPIIKTIIKLEEMGPQPAIIDFLKEREVARNFIASYNVKHVVIHRAYIHSYLHQYISEILPLEMIYKDKNQIGYKIADSGNLAKIGPRQLSPKFLNLSSFKTVIEEGTSSYAISNLRFRKNDVIHISGFNLKSISKVDITLDGNDLYEIVFKSEDKELRKFWVGPKETLTNKMARYKLELDPPLEQVNSISVRGVKGDKYYFIGHILLE